MTTDDTKDSSSHSGTEVKADTSLSQSRSPEVAWVNGGLSDFGSPPAGSPQLAITAVTQSFKGPYPPPDMIAAYEKALPGLGREIMTGFAEERKHRHALDLRQADVNEQLVRAQIEAVKRGSWFALVIVGIFACVAAYALSLGYPTTSAVILGVNLTGLVVVFIVRGNTGRRQDSKLD
jgi:uncharacterized membrane protein